MNITSEIEKKVDELVNHDSQEGIRAAIRHIKIAERWLRRGQEEQDEDFFNDVVYRSNQAFEGMLKEAFQVLEEKDASNLTPYKIEQHLLSNEVLTSRVLELFKNYRQEWRNPSTHDHSLLFNEQEALLAIVRVSAFAVVLLDQIVEKVNAVREKEELKSRRSELRDRLSGTEDSSLSDRAVAMLRLFGEEMGDTANLVETELLGRLTGFVESVDPEVSLSREVQLSDPHFRADLILSRASESVLVELKRFSKGGTVTERGKRQLMSYLKASDIDHGILFIPPGSGESLKLTTEVKSVGDRELHIHILEPESV